MTLAERSCPSCERSDCRRCGVALAESAALAGDLVDLLTQQPELELSPEACRLIDRTIELLYRDAADGGRR